MRVAAGRRIFNGRLRQYSSTRTRIIFDMGPQAGTHAFSLAPDGKSFLTTLERYRGDIWMLEGFPGPSPAGCFVNKNNINT